MEWFALVVGGLATWRVSNILVKQKGPLDIFVRFRAYLAQKHKKSGGLFDLVSCMTCTSVTIAAVTALWLSQDVLWWILYTMSFSAISSIIDALIASRSNK